MYLHLTSFRTQGRLTCTSTDINLNITSAILLLSTPFDTPIAQTFRFKRIIVLKCYYAKCRFYEKSPRYFGSSLAYCHILVEYINIAVHNCLQVAMSGVGHSPFTLLRFNICHMHKT